MIVRTTPTLARIGPRLRDVVLALGALFVGHDAVYLAQYGSGDAYARAMTAGGHDAYWSSTALVIGAAAGVIFVVALAVLARLQRQVGEGEARAAPAGASYLHELGGTWLRLFPTVAVLFAVQENVEHFAIDGDVHGLAVLGGTTVLPVLAATTLVLAALGALLRWRIRALAARLAAATSRQTYPRPAAAPRPRAWDTISAAIAHRWLLDRHVPGRAPPRTSAPRIDVATV